MITTIKILKEKLQNPENEYRSAPFWAWNDKLEDQELKLQMNEMNTAGVGGVFIHSREGLETPYLSEEWMSHVKTVTEHAKELGMDVWIYDEDKWPSGMAGGQVTAQCPEYAAKALTMELSSQRTYGEEQGILGIFRRMGQEGEYYFEKVSKEEVEFHTGNPHQKHSQDHFCIFRMERSGNHEWYNDYAPSDNLNPKSVSRFMELTHEKYKDMFQEEFGNTIKGFFTDEPNVCDFFATFTKDRPWLPWTGEFATYFQGKRGYDIMEFLPGLFYRTANSGKIRHDYFKTLAERFCESYFKQLAHWGEQENLVMTGHLLFENDFGYNPRTSGSAMLPYKYLDIPGIDILGELTEEILTVKQCTSVANQYGKEHVMSEMYGCTKWELDFEGQKWLGDWQFVMGVNMRCQHLALYSIKGLRKRDYPPVFNYQSNWWSYNQIIEDYFARFAICTGFGKAVRDILVIHPQSTMWMLSGSSETEDLSKIEGNMGWLDERMQKLNGIGNGFNLFIRGILGIHQDCDLGDELLIEEDGSVRDGRFYIAQAGYKIVVVPAVMTLFSNTLHLLEEFLMQGGTVITIGNPPQYIDGELSDQGQKLYEHKQVIRCKNDGEAIKVLDNSVRRISVINKEFAEDYHIYTMLRETDNCVMAILCNNDRNTEHEVIVTLEGTGRIQEYDLLQNTFREIQGEMIADSNQTRFVTLCQKTDSKVFLMNLEEKPNTRPVQFGFRHPHASDTVCMALPPAAFFIRDSLNVLVLDQCSYCLEDGRISVEMDIWRAQQEIRGKLGMRQIYYNGAPQRYGWIEEKVEKDKSLLTQYFSFQVNEIPTTPVYLAIEQSHYFTFMLNGKEVCNDKDITQGYYRDRCCHKILLPSLQKGRNEITVTCQYRNRMELEEMYLLGDFAVDNNRCICQEPETLHFGDWCLQGYPHYAGGIEYLFEITADISNKKAKILSLGKQESVVTEVSVNKVTVGIVPWPSADGLDLTSYLTQGKNLLGIKVVSTPRNVFGPFHQPYDKCKRISWADFRTKDNEYTNQYVLHPYGLVNQIVILEREESDLQ